MDIIQRNFYRLIRAGAFDLHEIVEPMSAFKWNKLRHLALMHGVSIPVWQGIQKCKNQFFFHLPEELWKQWEEPSRGMANKVMELEEDEFLRADLLTNPVLNHKLQNILDDEHSDVATRKLLLSLVCLTRHILNEGLPVRQLVELGTFIRKESPRIDYRLLQQWLKKLKIEQIAQLEGALLVDLFHFEEIEIPFLQEKKNKDVELVAQELTEFTNTRARDFYFSQESGEIFVHTSNGSAMLGHIRRSAKYFRYVPSEIVTNFFRTFTHSLSHIEE